MRLIDTQVRPRVRWGLWHAAPAAAMRRAARHGDPQATLFVAAHDPDTSHVLAAARRAREHGAVVQGRFASVALTMPTVKQVLTSPHMRAGFEGPPDSLLGRVMTWADEPDQLNPVAPPSLLATEPPDHTRYRKLVTRVFTVRAVEQLRERTQQIADELADRIAARGGNPVDLVDAYCAELPVTVIAEILGVPERDRALVLAFGTAAAPSLDLGLPWRRFRTMEHALDDFSAWLTDHLAWIAANPGDNLLSQLVAAREDGVGLDERELKATAGLVLAAGFETTVNLLGNGIDLLTRHPAQLAALRADPALWPNAVDEVLRFDPPVLMTGRMAADDTEVGGLPVRRGGPVVAMLSAANRDPDVFDDPDRFDVSRGNAGDHVSFSSGRHYCLGAALARMEGEIGLRTIFDRFDVELLAGARRRTTRILRGYESLPARLTPSPAHAPGRQARSAGRSEERGP